VHSFERLFAALAQDADSVDDYVDASQFRQPRRRIEVAREVRVDPGWRVPGATPGFDHRVTRGSQRIDQSRTDEAAGARDQDVHALTSGTVSRAQRFE
jgi:hypothetical protein